MKSLTYYLCHVYNRKVFARFAGEAAAQRSFTGYELIVAAGDGATKYLTDCLKSNPSQEEKDAALIAAANRGKDGAVTMLLDAGANPMAMNGKALWQAEFGSHKSTVSLLRNRAPAAEVEAYDRRHPGKPSDPGYWLRPI